VEEEEEEEEEEKESLWRKHACLSGLLWFVVHA